MSSFIQSDASEAKISCFKNFKSRIVAVAIGTFGAVLMSLALASAATTFGDHRTEGVSGGAVVQKSPGKCARARRFRQPFQPDEGGGDTAR
ncbi:hypothetical protein SAMN05216573_110146 [Bradyrhizobium sp. Rc3b]|nr:hypothetical protein SAMN05216573_110146 [Bradyrhizobium sp. Rc3b]